MYEISITHIKADYKIIASTNDVPAFDTCGEALFRRTVPFSYEFVDADKYAKVF